MTYEEYRNERQKEYDALPIFYAFSDWQFEEAMEKLGLTVNDTDKLYKLGKTGAFYLKKDAPIIEAFFKGRDKLPDLMKDYDFCFGACLYEMNNHEYCINWQGNYDVLSCFGNIEYTEDADELKQYFDQLGWSDTQRRAFLAARKKHYATTNC